MAHFFKKRKEGTYDLAGGGLMVSACLLLWRVEIKSYQKQQ